MTTRLCAWKECGIGFDATNAEHRYCSSKCRAAASREIALTGPRSRITGGPRKNKRGVSVTLLFTDDDAVRALKWNHGDSVHVYPADNDPATDN